MPASAGLWLGENHRGEPPSVVGLGGEINGAKSGEFFARTIVAGKQAFDERGTRVEGADFQAMDVGAGIIRPSQLVKEGAPEAAQRRAIRQGQIAVVQDHGGRDTEEIYPRFEVGALAARQAREVLA